MNKQISVERILHNILQFESMNHPAWDQNEQFSNRIKNLPLYYLEFNHYKRNKASQSVTVTHYVPHQTEMMALSQIVKAYNKNFVICDVGCGNGFLGSLLAREGVNVFGIDDRSYLQPQIANFCDDECYEIIETCLSDPKINFDVAFCSWMTPDKNLTPQIVAKKPSLIIHVFSPDKQPNGSPTTGVPKAYLCPPDYRLLVAWGSVFPQDYFLPLNELSGSNLSGNPYIKIRCVSVYVHNKLKSIDPISPIDLTGSYDWDIERDFINQLRNVKGLQQCSMKCVWNNLTNAKACGKILATFARLLASLLCHSEKNDMPTFG